MNFTREQVQKLLTGSLTQLRVLKKEKEYLCEDIAKKTTWFIRKENPITGKIKFQTNKSYTVMVKDNAVWYDTANGNIHYNHPLSDTFTKKNKEVKQLWFKHFPNLKPLHFKFTSIRAEELDISEDDAKKCGFPSKEFPSPSREISFWWWFHIHNKLKFIDGAFQNPDIWVLDGVEVVK